MWYTSKLRYKKTSLLVFVFAAFFVLINFNTPLTHAGVVSIVLNPWYASPSTVAPGGSATLYWTATYADQCQFSGGWFGDAMNPPNNSATYPGATWTGSRSGYVTILSGDHGAIGSGVLNSGTNFYIRCTNSGPSNTGDSGWVALYVPVGVADNCATPAVLSGKGFAVAPGPRNLKATINGTAYNFCINNQSTSTFFVPLSSPAEYTAFRNAVGIGPLSQLSYAPRAPGY